uniref:Phytoene dehydrogenase n=1 Tax=Lygus hesperus TaxID=30085 RepID=A0A0A9XZE9_LYGHE
MTKEPNVVFRGRGRPVFIPQEILDQQVRRPVSTAPPPLPSHNSDLAQFTPLFSGKQVDDFKIYRIMETYIFKEARGLQDLQKMMQRLTELALECHRNVPTICKYLYVFSQDPKGSDLRNAFFSNLESDFLNRAELRKREGPVRYRNFIKWVMSAAHHYRNLLYAPFDELMLSLLELANEISEFNDADDIPLYVTLILRFYYYTSLPCSDGTDVSAKLGEEHMAAIVRARNHVRRRVAKGGLSAEHVNWLILLLEVTRTSPTIERDIAEYYGDILPGFALLLPESLRIRLPEGCPRLRHLEHISRFVSR